MVTGVQSQGMITTIRVVVAFSILVVAVALYFLTTVTPTGKPAGLSDTPECPHDWREAIRTAPKWNDRVPAMAVPPGTVGPAGAPLSVPEHITNIPEFHDCQKLRVVDANGVPAYDALAAVFARQGLDTIPVGDFQSPLTAAVVFLPRGGQYPKLNILTVYSCLVLRKNPTWEAWMVPAQVELACDSAIPTSELTEARRLEIRALSPDVFKLKADDIPGVARWDWDSAGAQQYIGVRCGNEWCSVGAKGFQDSPRYVVSGADGSLSQRTTIFRGWYDEQHLAEFSGANLVPTNNLGTVLPTPQLTASTSTEAVLGDWVPVAHVHTQAATGTYEETFNFAKGAGIPPKDPRSSLSICASLDDKECAPEPFLIFKRRFAGGACTPDSDGRKWYARIEHPTKRPRYFCVIFRGHPAHFRIPPVVRWRWRENDETVWVSCPFGCCEVNGDG